MLSRPTHWLSWILCCAMLGLLAAPIFSIVYAALGRLHQPPRSDAYPGVLRRQS